MQSRQAMTGLQVIFETYSFRCAVGASVCDSPESLFDIITAKPLSDLLPVIIKRQLLKSIKLRKVVKDSLFFTELYAL